jgi:hypothetical protein
VDVLEIPATIALAIQLFSFHLFEQTLLPGIVVYPQSCCSVGSEEVELISR